MDTLEVALIFVVFLLFMRKSKKYINTIENEWYSYYWKMEDKITNASGEAKIRYIDLRKQKNITYHLLITIVMLSAIWLWLLSCWFILYCFK